MRISKAFCDSHMSFCRFFLLKPCHLLYFGENKLLFHLEWAIRMRIYISRVVVLMTKCVRARQNLNKILSYACNFSYLVSCYVAENSLRLFRSPFNRLALVKNSLSSLRFKLLFGIQITLGFLHCRVFHIF